MTTQAQTTQVTTASAESTVLYTEHDSFVVVTLNRPAALNSFTPQMHQDLWKVLDQAEGNPKIRALVLTGAGRGFCAGADLAAFDFTPGPGLVERADPGPTIDKNFNVTARRFHTLRMPTVCAVNGVAAGAGVSFALGCDVVFAAPTASFIQAFSKIGLIPDAGGTWFLTERLGLARAMALAMTGDKLSAQQAKDWGMIWDVAKDGEDVLTLATNFAARLAAMPTKALVATRHTLRASGTNTFNQQLDLERDTQSAMGKTHDYFEGVKAFLEKRPAAFKGE